jgi:aryl-alcohol dehydrogenase-like predicted oxidoreductase
MEYRKLGTTDIEVSVVAMGCWAIAGDATWGDQDEADSIATIHTALDEGVNFFDTAESYGDGYSEEVVGRALKDRRTEAIIASKVSASNLRPADLRAACEASLGRLQTDYIDLYQIHWPNWDLSIEEAYETLKDLQAEGKTRAIGVCNFGQQDFTELLEVGDVATNQLPYNLLWRAIEFEIQPICVEHKVGILPYSPLMQGLLTGKFGSPDEVPESRARTRHYSSEKRAQTRHGESGQEVETFAAVERIRGICDRIGAPMAQVALAWLLAQPAVTSVLAGARHPRQITENAQAAELELSDEIVAELTAATDELKQRFGPNPDMWQSEENSRYR